MFDEQENFFSKKSYLKEERVKFFEKNKLLIQSYGEPWSADKVYDFIFRDFIQEEGVLDSEKYNGVLIYSQKDKDGKRRFKREMFFKGSNLLLKRSRMPFLITNGVLYAGKKNKVENARLMCAMIIDLDGVDSIDKLKLLLHRFEMPLDVPGQANHITKPTFLVNSGTGFHVYYVFEKPIPMFPSVRRQLMEFKRQLTRHLWVVGITDKTGENEVQYQPVTQGFRAVGSNTKIGTRCKVTAFKLADRYPIEYWKEWIERQSKAYRNKELVPISTEYVSKLSKEMAKELYPEWYQRKIERKETKSYFIVNRALYDWYKRELLEKEESIEGKRYYRTMCLAIYAKKCGISYEELETDALEFMVKLNKAHHKHQFTEDDVHAALEMYNENYYTFPRNSIRYLTGFDIKENKRNGRKQEIHLKGARAVQGVYNPEWRKGNGRKSKKEIILRKVRDKNISGVLESNKTPKELAKETGISRKTIIKHLKDSSPEIASLVKRGRITKEKEVKELLEKYPAKNVSELSKISGIDRKTIKKYFSKNEK